MHRHNIFTLGIILTTIAIPSYAYRSRDAADVWTDPSRTTPAKEICLDGCAEGSCWLPNGTYYDNMGTFTESCTGELSCPYGHNIGFDSCIDTPTSGSDYGYWDFGGTTRNTTTYSLTAGGQWGVTFDVSGGSGNVKGIASCNNTPGRYATATDTEFNNTANGQYCWCKMTSPSVSRWVHDSNTGSANTCASSCASECGRIVLGSYSALRDTIFRSLVSSESPFDQTYARGLKECCPVGTDEVVGFSSCINLSANGSARGFRNNPGGMFGARSSNVDTYGLTENNTWGVTFDYGIVKGIASCNSTSGSFGVATDEEFSQTSGGGNCWCKMTSPAASRWVFLNSPEIISLCFDQCADSCSSKVQSDSSFRSGVFGPVGN